MDMVVNFPGGARVDASFGPYTVSTDQPPQGGGQGSAPTPFALFLSSIATCAGIYVLEFLQKRGLPTENVRLRQHITTSPLSRMVEKISIEIQVPEDFPKKYRQALARAAELCAVKKHLTYPPEIAIQTKFLNGKQG